MNGDYVDRDAEKVEMMGEISRESRVSETERHQKSEAHRGRPERIIRIHEGKKIH